MAGRSSDSGEAFLKREELLVIYNFLGKVRSFTEQFNLCSLVRAFNEQTGKNLSTYNFDGAIKVFEELGLLIIDSDKKTFELPRPKNKLNLSNSRTFRLSRGEPLSSKIISLASARKAMRNS